MRLLIYRPDKKEHKLDEDCLYNPNGSKYKKTEEKPKQHPFDKIYKYPIKQKNVTIVTVNKKNVTAKTLIDKGLKANSNESNESNATKTQNH